MLEGKATVALEGGMEDATGSGEAVDAPAGEEAAEGAVGATADAMSSVATGVALGTATARALPSGTSSPTGGDRLVYRGLRTMQPAM